MSDVERSCLRNVSTRHSNAITKMRKFSINFFVYTLTGIWQPVEWSSSCAKVLYSTFTACVIIQLYFFMMIQLMDLVLTVDNIDDFTNSSLIWVTVINGCCKATTPVLRRRAIINLVEMLLTDPCKPRNEDELAIQAKFDTFIRTWSIKYFLLWMCTLTSFTIGSVLDVIRGHLPHRVWLPYDLNKSPMFLIMSTYQIIMIIFVACIDIATETLVFSLILQTCAQLDILKSRLNKSVINQTTGYRQNQMFFLPNVRQAVISEHIRHHLIIYMYAKRVNNIFNQVFFIQFFGSILMICTSMYYILIHITDFVIVMGIAGYTTFLFVQIFVYCWAGNEVIFKSMSLADAIYHLDWSSLSIRERKNLLMIMKRSSAPIMFTSSFLITLSLESYGNILKTSYSAFNILQS